MTKQFYVLSSDFFNFWNRSGPIVPQFPLWYGSFYGSHLNFNQVIIYQPLHLWSPTSFLGRCQVASV